MKVGTDTQTGPFRNQAPIETLTMVELRGLEPLYSKSYSDSILVHGVFRVRKSRISRNTRFLQGILSVSPQYVTIRQISLILQ